MTYGTVLSTTGNQDHRMPCKSKKPKRSGKKRTKRGNPAKYANDPMFKAMHS